MLDRSKGQIAAGTADMIDRSMGGLTQVNIYGMIDRSTGQIAAGTADMIDRSMGWIDTGKHI